MKRIESDHLCKFRDELATALGRERRLKIEIERLEAEIERLEKLAHRRQAHMDA